MAAGLKILCGNSNEPLAKDICEYLRISLGETTVSKFSDGEIQIQINEDIRGTDVFIVQSTNSPAENLLELLLLLDAVKRASARRVTAVIPYFGYARQDRKAAPRVPISAKVAANLIVAAGADRVLTMDLHAPQIQGFFDVPLDHLYSALVFTRRLKELDTPGNLVIVSPDAGGMAMARSYSKRLNCPLALVDKPMTLIITLSRSRLVISVNLKDAFAQHVPITGPSPPTEPTDGQRFSKKCKYYCSRERGPYNSL